MFAVLLTGGKQYLVQKDDIIYIEKIDGAVGDTITFDKILMIDNKPGNPYLPNANVLGTIEKQGKQRKITIIKHLSQKHHRRKFGHRQLYTKIKIVAINP